MTPQTCCQGFNKRESRTKVTNKTEKRHVNSTAVNAKMTQTKYKPLACNLKAISEKLISAVCAQDA